jgi:hypothetical protein
MMEDKLREYSATTDPRDIDALDDEVRGSVGPLLDGVLGVLQWGFLGMAAPGKLHLCRIIGPGCALTGSPAQPTGYFAQGAHHRMPRQHAVHHIWQGEDFDISICLC